MPWGLAIGAALGLAKSEMVDRPKEEKSRKLEAATAKYSPWTHMQPKSVQQADPFGSALQFGGTGASMGHGFSQDQMMKDYLAKQGGVGLADGAAGGINNGASFWDANQPYLGNYQYK